MNLCARIRRALTTNFIMPVLAFFERAREVCEETRRRIEERVSRPVEEWVARRERRCRRRRRFRRFFCRLVNAVVKAVTWVVVTVIKWVTYLVCKIVVDVVRIVVGFIVKVVAWVAAFMVCLFVDPLQALASIRDLYTAVLDLVDDVFDFIESLLDDAGDILADVEILIAALADSLGPLGAFFLGVVKWVLHVARDLLDIVNTVVGGVQDLIVGLLRGNLCRALAGLTDLGIGVLRTVFAVTRVPFGSLAGVRDSVNLADVEDEVIGALQNALRPDEDRLERALDRVAVGTRPMGYPFVADLRRFFLSSTSTAIDLRALHANDIVDLFALAGHRSRCQNGLRSSRGEVVYEGTRQTVTRTDLERFLDDGADAVPPFRVYPIKEEILSRHFEVAKRKAAFLGIRLARRPFGDIEITNLNQIPLDADGDTTAVHSAQFAVFGRSGSRDDLAQLPGIAHFGFIDTDLNGLASWYRPPDDLSMSGVSYRDRSPDALFRYVLVHEMGHYWGLDHEGHDSPRFIMWTPRLATDIGDAALEFILLSGEPTFSRQDVKDAWRWMTGPEVVDILFP